MPPIFGFFEIMKISGILIMIIIIITIIGGNILAAMRPLFLHECFYDFPTSFQKSEKTKIGGTYCFAIV
jgi:hypothetical protein